MRTFSANQKLFVDVYFCPDYPDKGLLNWPIPKIESNNSKNNRDIQ